MTKVLVTRGNLEDTAGAIRTKLGVQTTYKPSQFAAAIGSITGVTSDDNGKVVVNGVLTAQTSKSISTNGTHDTTANNEVVVSVPTQANLGTKTITQNGTYAATDDNLDGYSSVVVNVSGGGSSSVYTNESLNVLSLYTFNTAGERLCTANGRGYYKYTNDEAYGCYDTSALNGPPFLISKNPDAVKYTADSGGPFSYNATFTYNGETWYVSNVQHAWSAGQQNTNGSLKDFYFAKTDRGQKGLEFLEFILSIPSGTIDVFRVSKKGVYTAPSGYDGFGALFVE